VARLGAAADLHLEASTDEEAREHVPSGDGIRILLNGPGSTPEFRMVPSVKHHPNHDTEWCPRQESNLRHPV
jgi:hypothetical protein